MVGKICKILMNAIMIILILLVGILFVPRFFGYQNFAVISGSMEPTMPIGSMVFDKERNFEDIKIGDIISYQVNSQTRVTHRVVEIDNQTRSFITKGDANDVNDTYPVEYADVIGVVDFCVPLIGYITMYIKTPLGIAVGCGILFIIMLLNFLPHLLQKNEK